MNRSLHKICHTLFCPKSGKYLEYLQLYSLCFSGIHINSMENKKTEWYSELQWKECNYTP